MTHAMGMVAILVMVLAVLWIIDDVHRNGLP